MLGEVRFLELVGRVSVHGFGLGRVLWHLALAQEVRWPTLYLAKNRPIAQKQDQTLYLQIFDRYWYGLASDCHDYCGLLGHNAKGE